MKGDSIKEQLLIREHNIRAHLDVEKDMQKKRDGLFTFVLKVHDGMITDYVNLESSKYVTT